MIGSKRSLAREAAAYAQRLRSPMVGLLSASALALAASTALAEEALVETVGGWIVECGKTEAGGRECTLRNDEDGKPALEQVALLSFTLHDGKNEVDGLVRVADLDLPPRLDVEIAFGSGDAMTVEGRPAPPARGAVCHAEAGAGGPGRRRCRPGALRRPAGAAA